MIVLTQPLPEQECQDLLHDGHQLWGRRRSGHGRRNRVCRRACRRWRLRHGDEAPVRQDHVNLSRPSLRYKQRRQATVPPAFIRGDSREQQEAPGPPPPPVPHVQSGIYPKSVSGAVPHGYYLVASTCLPRVEMTTHRLRVPHIACDWIRAVFPTCDLLCPRS